MTNLAELKESSAESLGPIRLPPIYKVGQARQIVHNGRGD